MRSDADTSQTNPQRLLPLDLLRGLLIILMALDHANYFIAQQHTTGEHWGGFFPVYATPAHFLTRFVTHLSAPGFFFLMGTGMVLFSQARKNIGWSSGMVRRHFLFRGLSLILLQLLVVNFVWSLSPASFPRWYIGVLVALGAGMILCVALLDLKPIYLVGAALGMFIIMELLTPAPEMWGTNFDNPAGLLLVYSGGDNNFWVNYPILAWVELIIFGMAFGKWLLIDERKTFRISPYLGISFLVLFIGLRLQNGFGNIRPYSPGSWIDFLNMVKYPPSMTFGLFTMGVNLLLLSLFSNLKRAGQNPGNPLVVFGRVPLFSYIAHLCVYALIGRLLTPEGSSLGMMIFLWILGLAVIYWPARWYGEYKKTRPAESWVRFL
jgi:uncharacterized membrane protein